MRQPVFPTLRIFADRFEALGEFAESQAMWFTPSLVARLDTALAQHNAHPCHVDVMPTLESPLSAANHDF